MLAVKVAPGVTLRVWVTVSSGVVSVGVKMAAPGGVTVCVNGRTLPLLLNHALR